MNKNAKFGLCLLFVSFTFILMVSVEPVGAPGDYVLEWLGLKAWSSDRSGFHLTILYFGIPFVIGLKLLGRYRRELRISGFKTFMLSIVLITCMNFAVVEVAEYIKSSSEGLLVLGYDRENSTYEIEQTPQSTKFDIRVKVTNYSNEPKSFSLAIDSSLRRFENKKPLRVMNEKGEEAIFELAGKKTNTFVITSENFELENNVLEKGVSHSSRSAEIQELILESPDGEVVKLVADGYFGVVIEVVR